MAPTRTQLQNLFQKKEESFKEYAQRWRETTSGVQPPLLEKELVDMFIETLQGLYYENMVGNVSSGFSNLVTIDERIKAGIKSENIQGTSSYNSKRHNFSQKGEGEINVVASQPRAPEQLIIPRGHR